MSERELTVDVLVVGSGNGGLTAALCAYELGLKDVLVVEKSELYGGTSATSGGGVWMPCNRYARGGRGAGQLRGGTRVPAAARFRRAPSPTR